MNGRPFFDSFKDTPACLWMEVFLWCAVIFSVSSFPDYRGGTPDLESLKGILKVISRKLAHLTEYAILMILLYRAMDKSFISLRRWNFLLSFVLAVLYAVSDEWHQTFVFGRTGSGMDVFIDAVGSLSGFFIRYGGR